MLNIEVKKLTETAKIPTRGHPADAGYDLYVDRVEYVHRKIDHHIPNTSLTNDMIRIIESYEFDMFKVHTGVAVNIPLGYFGRIVPRSSTPGKNLQVHCGTIDSGYTGELIVLAWPRHAPNAANRLVWPEAGDRIAQLIIQKHENANWRITDDLGESERTIAPTSGRTSP
jgi:dUTP pyrophosphatase